MKYAFFLSLFCVVSFSVNAQRTNRLDSTGNAGVGILAPTEKFEIYSNGLSNIKLTHSADVLGTVGAIKFNMAGTDVGRLEVERTIASGRRSVMKFFVRGDSLSEAMRILDNGFVGIGDKSPSAKFHVNGDSGTAFLRVTQSNVPELEGSLVVRNATGSTGVFIPSIIGRTSFPGRAFGLYITGEAEDVLPANDDFVAAVILDGRSKTGTKLQTNNVLAVNSLGVNLMMVKANGSVGIGTSETKGYKLAVNGSGIFTRVVVKAYNNWPDFVFNNDYKLPSLSETEAFIKTNKHLPNIPSAAEVAKDGIDLGEMNQKLLQKIEEQMLYIIEMNKKITSLTNEVKDLKEKVVAK